MQTARLSIKMARLRISSLRSNNCHWSSKKCIKKWLLQSKQRNAIHNISKSLLTIPLSKWIRKSIRCCNCSKTRYCTQARHIIRRKYISVRKPTRPLKTKIISFYANRSSTRLKRRSKEQWLTNSCKTSTRSNRALSRTPSQLSKSTKNAWKRKKLWPILSTWIC